MSEQEELEHYAKCTTPIRACVRCLRVVGAVRQSEHVPIVEMVPYTDKELHEMQRIHVPMIGTNICSTCPDGTHWPCQVTRLIATISTMRMASDEHV